MDNIFSKIGFSIIAVFTAIGGLFSVPNAPKEIKTAIPGIVATDPRVIKMQKDLDFIQKEVHILQNQTSLKFGTTFALDTPVALFEDSLASALAKTDTTMTLVSGNDINGTALASSTYGFIIDQGTSKQELVRADCTGTACTNMSRGISIVDGTSTVAALQFTHRAGASVKITDAPLLLQTIRIVQGIGTFPNIISYSTAPTFTTGNQIITKTYADNLAIAGAPNASLTQKGIAQLSTGLQAASSTPTGSTGAPLMLHSLIATSSPYQAGNVIPVTQASGFLNQAFYNFGEQWNFTGGGGLGVIMNAATSTNATTTTLSVSGALRLNGVSYKLPSANQASSTFLGNDGSGNLSWSSASDWQQLGETIATSSQASLNVNSFSARKDLRIVVFVASGNSVKTQFQFNNDAGSNYQIQSWYNFGNPNSQGGATLIQTGLAITATTTQQYWTLDLGNLATEQKRIIGQGSFGNLGMETFIGNWTNTANQITTVSVGSSGSSFPTNSRVTVYGKKD